MRNISFEPVGVKDAENFMKNIPNNKASECGMPSHICQLTCFLNDAIIKGIFPDSFKIANITHVG